MATKTTSISVDLDGWDPYPWQNRGLPTLCRNNVWVVSRQAGKSALLRYLISSFAMKFPGTRYGYVTPTKKRSGEFFKELYSKFPKDVVEGDFTNRILTFRTDPPSAIDFVSMEQYAGLEGGTWNGMICDECQLMLGWIVRGSLRPMLAKTGGWCVYSGKPPNPDTAPDPFFYEELYEMACEANGIKPHSEESFGCHVTKGDWGLIHLDHSCLSDIDPIYATYVEEERIQNRNDPGAYEREFLCRFSKPGEGTLDISLLKYFTFEDIQDVDLNVVITVDPSVSEKETADPRAIVATGLSPAGNLYVLWAQAGRWPYSQFIGKMYECFQWCCDLGRNTEPDYLRLETSGGGQYLYHALLREGEFRQDAGMSPGYIPVQETPSAQNVQSKRQRCLSLEPWLTERKLFFLRDDDGCRGLKTQMAYFPRGLVAGTKKGVHGHHYDLLDALAWRTVDFSPPREGTPEKEIVRVGPKIVDGKLVLVDDDFRSFMNKPKDDRRTWHV